MESSYSVIGASQQLFNLIIKENDLEKVLNLGEELLQSPILYLDYLSNNNLVSKEYPQKVLENKDLESNYLSLLKCNSEYILNIDTITDNTPFIVTISPSSRVLISKIYYGDGYIGNIIIPEVNVSVESLNMEIVKQISNTCGISYLLKDNSSHIEKFLNDENIIFDQILSEKYKTINEFNFLCKRYSFKDYDKFYIIGIHLISSNLKLIENKLSKITKICEIGFWTKVHDVGIIAMIGINNITTGISEVLEELNKIYIDEKVIIAVSDPFTHILSTRKHLKDIESIILYAKSHISNKKVYLCDDYKFRKFLSDVNPLINTATHYISYKIMDILNYDLKNNTEYAITLRAYLSQSLSPQATSKSLFIHRNTVIYRINKIKELFNIDFTDADQCFQLYFSFQLLMVRGWGRENQIIN